MTDKIRGMVLVKIQFHALKLQSCKGQDILGGSQKGRQVLMLKKNNNWLNYTPYMICLKVLAMKNFAGRSMGNAAKSQVKVIMQ